MKDLAGNNEDPERHNRDLVCLTKGDSQKPAPKQQRTQQTNKCRKTKQTERKPLKWPAFLQAGSLELRRKEKGIVVLLRFY